MVKDYEFEVVGRLFNNGFRTGYVLRAKNGEYRGFSVDMLANPDILVKVKGLDYVNGKFIGKDGLELRSLDIFTEADIAEYNAKRLEMRQRLGLPVSGEKGVVGYSKVTLYHGSPNDSLIPVYGGGKSGNNDFGDGFYAAVDRNLAAEWSFLYNYAALGYVYVYELDLRGLNCFEFKDSDYLSWIATLLKYRQLGNYADNHLMVKRDDFIFRHGINLEKYDVIIGYRVDAKFSRLMKLYLTGKVTGEKILDYLKAGDLGIQYCVRTKKAYNHLILKDKLIYKRNEFGRKMQDRFTKADEYISEMLQK